MKILVLSFYFHPDLSACSFRASSLLNELMSMLPAESHIDVITTRPNRYSTFSAEASELERFSMLDIHRIALPSHQSGMLDQSKAFMSFSCQVLRHIEYRDYDLVFSTSSRLMTAVLGAWIARQKRSLLYLDIRDIFVDTIKYVLPKYLTLFTKPCFSVLEYWAVNRAVRVNIVSPGFADYFLSRYPDKRFSYFTNGIDDEFISAASEISSGRMYADAQLTVLYAGNIGEGQGLHVILPALAKRMEGRVQFRVIGDGGRKETLREALALLGVSNVELLPPVKRDNLIKLYQEADVLFLHLNDYNAFKKVLPSKLFEYAAMGKPIWAGVSGYAAEFMRLEITNSAVFHPCNVMEAELVFGELNLQYTAREGFLRKFARRNIMKEMAKEIITIAGGVD